MMMMIITIIKLHSLYRVNLYVFVVNKKRQGEKIN